MSSSVLRVASARLGFMTSRDALSEEFWLIWPHEEEYSQACTLLQLWNAC